MSALEDKFENLLIKHKLKYKREVSVVEGRKFKWDFLVSIKKRKVAVEIQGGAWLGRRGGHTGGKGLERDSYKTLLAHQTGIQYLTTTAKGEANLEVVAEYLSTLK